MEGGSPYPQLIIYGGKTDEWSAVVLVIEFDTMALSDTEYLNAYGHDVVLCNHDSGHTIPYDFMGLQVIEFFAAHPRDTMDSPFADGLPDDYPSYCEVHPKD